MEGAQHLESGERHKWNRQRILQPQEEGGEDIPDLPCRVPEARTSGQCAPEPRPVRRQLARHHRVGRRHQGGGQDRERAAILRV